MPVNIGFLSPWPIDSCCPYIRVVSPLKYLALTGKVAIWDMLTISKTGIEYYLENISKVEVVILQRHFPAYYALNYPEIPLSRLLQGKKVILDFDDLLHNLDGYIQNADAVSVSTAVIKNYYHPKNSNTIIIPNRLDPELWPFLNTPATSADDGKFKVLFAGSKTHQEDINLIEPVIQELIIRYHDQIEFLFWGDYPPTLKNKSQIKILPHQKSYLEYAKQLQNLQVDLALIPLLPTAFNEAKSNIKFLEYSICNIPGIYSNLAPYREIEHGQTGIVANYDLNNWLDYIIEMLENTQLRKSISERAYNFVHKNYNLKNNCSEWNQIIDSM